MDNKDLFWKVLIGLLFIMGAKSNNIIIKIILLIAGVASIDAYINKKTNKLLK